MILIVSAPFSCGLIELQAEKEKHGEYTQSIYVLNSR